MMVSVRLLRSSDDRSRFHSGQVDLDRFFIRYAGQNQFRHHIGATYAAVDEHEVVVGFVTVSASHPAALLVQGMSLNPDVCRVNDAG